MNKKICASFCVVVMAFQLVASAPPSGFFPLLAQKEHSFKEPFGKSIRFFSSFPVVQKSIPVAENGVVAAKTAGTVDQGTGAGSLRTVQVPVAVPQDVSQTGGPLRNVQVPVAFPQGARAVTGTTQNASPPRIVPGIFAPTPVPVQVPVAVPLTSAVRADLDTQQVEFEENPEAYYKFDTSIQDTINDQSVTRHEEREGVNLRGLYSYSDGFFRRTVHYEADKGGYRVTKEDIEPIGNGPRFNPGGRADIRSTVSGDYSVTLQDYQVPQVVRQ